METTFADMAQRLKALDISQVAEVATDITSPAISQLNREQLEEGFDSNGERLNKYRNPIYARKKAAMNPKPGLGNPDLKLTGSFYRGIRADVEDGQIHVYSTDSKDPELVEKYGSDIYGLGTEKGNEYIKDHLQPSFQGLIREKLKL